MCWLSVFFGLSTGEVLCVWLRPTTQAHAINHALFPIKKYIAHSVCMRRLHWRQANEMNVWRPFSHKQKLAAGNCWCCDKRVGLESIGVGVESICVGGEGVKDESCRRLMEECHSSWNRHHWRCLRWQLNSVLNPYFISFPFWTTAGEVFPHEGFFHQILALISSRHPLP